MYEANVVGTENVLRSALEARIPRVVYISTVGAFGNTRGQVVDESYEHPGTGYTSYYEETKVEAHRLAKRLIAEQGLPCVIVQPGGVYGPEDHSALGRQMNQFLAGRMPMIAFPDLGMNMVHVDDVAKGMLLALDRGKVGEAYVLGGQITTMRKLIDTLARVADKKAPKRALPTSLMRAMTPLGPIVGKVMNQGPNLRELISSADGVTFWARHDKAMAELGYSPRGLEQGLRDTLEAEGKLPGSPVAASA
jgi:nucleoside-diphosphate-sugar epimerase